MKRWTMVLLSLILAAVLAGCGCQHEWQEATCLTPKTCTLCQETEGEALGHSWQEATCEAAKTCAVCGETEGEPLGHTLTDWSFDGENAMVHSCGSCGMEESCTMEAYLQEHLAGHWDAASVMNLSRQSEDDPYWEDVRYYYSDIPYMKILENGSHEVFAGSVHYTDCRMEFISASQNVKIPPNQEPCDAYHFGLHPEEGKGVWFFYAPREDAVFLMGYIRFERADPVKE